MEKLVLRDLKCLISDSSDFSLRNHAPLWLIWTLLVLYLSLFLLSLKNNLKNCSLLVVSDCPDFPRSWWNVSMRLIGVEMMFVLLRLVCASVSMMLFITACLDRCLWGCCIKICPSMLLVSPSGLQQCTIETRIGRYVDSYYVFDLKTFLQLSIVYKICYYQLETNIPLLFLFIHPYLADFTVKISLVGFLCSAMAPSDALGKNKGKEKVPLGTDPVTYSNINICTKATNSKNLPTLKLPSGGSTSKNKAKTSMGSKNRLDLTAMFKKLAATRENGKKKELTLVGFLIGEPKEFPRLFAKLRMEWKPLQGHVILIVLKFGWFEIAFSNNTDFQLIWANRPYHVFSQLLLIKQWYPGFDPTSESISQLDLWVRLHYLPEEFANADALETIIKGNGVGNFLKMDPSHNSERWNMFTRFCINTDVEQTFGKGVIVPDEHLNQIKFSLWFDDFSPGCGACGKSAHTFRDCPQKNAQIPTLQLTIKKPSSKKHAFEETIPQPMEKGGWNMIGKKNKVVKHSNIAIPNGNIYLSERSGIKVTYESEESEEGIQQMLESEDDFPNHTNLLSVAGLLNYHYKSKLCQCNSNKCVSICLPPSTRSLTSSCGCATDLHPYNLFSEEKGYSKINKEKGCFSLTPTSDNVHPIENQSKNPVKDNLWTDGNPPPQVEGRKDKDTHWNLTKDAPHPGFQQEEIAPTLINNEDTKKAMINTKITKRGQFVLEKGLWSCLGAAFDSPTDPKGIMEIGCPSLSIEKTELLEHSLEHLQAMINSNKKTSPPMQLDEDLSDYYEEQYEYEYDDLLVDEMPEIIHPNPLPSLTMNADNPIMISEDPPFSEKDLEEFINNGELEGNVDQLISEGTFHSMQNSIHSSSSYVNGMERLNVHHSDKSTSNSSKRRVIEGVEDTATSEKRAGKKTKY